MLELVKDFLLVSMGMGIGVVLMCILNVGINANIRMYRNDHLKMYKITL